MNVSYLIQAVHKFDAGYRNCNHMNNMRVDLVNVVAVSVTRASLLTDGERSKFAFIGNILGNTVGQA